jgi:hypothetical protein
MEEEVIEKPAEPFIAQLGDLVLSSVVEEVNKYCPDHKVAAVLQTLMFALVRACVTTVKPDSEEMVIKSVAETLRANFDKHRESRVKQHACTTADSDIS